MTIWNEEMYVIKKMKQNLSASVMTNIKSNTLNGSELLIYTELPWRIFKSNKLKKLYIFALYFVVVPKKFQQLATAWYQS